MTDAMQAIAAALQTDAESVRIIAQNIANAQNPAYRREIAVTSTSFDAVTSAVHAAKMRSVIDRTPGTLRNTGEPLHLAVEGSGFFVIDTGQGELLTRRGDFRLDGDGQLVTHDGLAVLGGKGPIHIDGGSPAIDPDGTVRLAGTVVDRLRIAEVPKDTDLQPAGEEGYVLADGQTPPDAVAPIVRQGFLETSNVQSVNEMVQLMDTMRRFEAAQHFVRGYDGMTDEAIKTLGKI